MTKQKESFGNIPKPNILDKVDESKKIQKKVKRTISKKQQEKMQEAKAIKQYFKKKLKEGLMARFGKDVNIWQYIPSRTPRDRSEEAKKIVKEIMEELHLVNPYPEWKPPKQKKKPLTAEQKQKLVQRFHKNKHNDIDDFVLKEYTQKNGIKIYKVEPPNFNIQDPDNQKEYELPVLLEAVHKYMPDGERQWFVTILVGKDYLTLGKFTKAQLKARVKELINQKRQYELGLTHEYDDNYWVVIKYGYAAHFF